MVVTRKEYVRHSRPILKSRRWKALRQTILERDDWACVDCGERHRRLEVDHIVPVRNRPDLSFAPANLATRCSACHTRKTRIECGFKPPDPKRQAWRKSVAELATPSKKV